MRRRKGRKMGKDKKKGAGKGGRWRRGERKTQRTVRRFSTEDLVQQDNKVREREYWTTEEEKLCKTCKRENKSFL